MQQLKSLPVSRGRKQVPKARDDAAGNPGRRGSKTEVVSAPGSPTMPDTIGFDEEQFARDAFAHFQRLMDGTPGWLQATDAIALEMAAVHYAAWKRCEIDSRRNPEDLALRKMAIQEADFVRKMLATLGLTPTDRAKVAAPGTDGSKTIEQELLGDG
jgi:hypothetical protein